MLALEQQSDSEVQREKKKDFLLSIAHRVTLIKLPLPNNRWNSHAHDLIARTIMTNRERSSVREVNEGQSLAT